MTKQGSKTVEGEPSHRIYCWLFVIILTHWHVCAYLLVTGFAYKLFPHVKIPRDGSWAVVNSLPLCTEFFGQACTHFHLLFNTPLCPTFSISFSEILSSELSIFVKFFAQKDKNFQALTKMFVFMLLLMSYLTLQYEKVSSGPRPRRIWMDRHEIWCQFITIIKRRESTSARRINWNSG